MATPAATATTVTSIPWWKEPTRDQWYAFVAAWAGWTLDAFDFTAFLLIIAPIAKEFDVPVPEVAAVLTITLWMRLIGATASGWLADRIGRKTPLMISIAWYRSEEHTSELQSRENLVCRLLLEKKNNCNSIITS